MNLKYKDKHKILSFLFDKNDNWKFYRKRYKDLSIFFDKKKLLSHAIKYGVYENREIIRNKNDNKLFYIYSLTLNEDNINIKNIIEKIDYEISYAKINMSQYILKVIENIKSNNSDIESFDKDDLKEKYLKEKDENIMEKKIKENELKKKNLENKGKIFELELKIFLKMNNITRIYVSNSLKHFEDRIKKKYNLSNYNKYFPCLFFGIYDDNDKYFINNHKGNKYIICGGSDLPNVKQLQNYQNLIYLSISKNIYDRLSEFNLKSVLVKFNLVDNNLFSKIDTYGEKIYIYDGFTKKEDNYNIYGLKYINEIKEHLPHYQYIHSSDLNLSYNEMPNIYKQCFIGLRLTNNDGNANTVQEFEAMNIPIVHNISDYGLKWKSIDCVIKHIIYCDKNSVKEETIIQEPIVQEPIVQEPIVQEHVSQNSIEVMEQTIKYNFSYLNSLNNVILKNIYQNIDYFNNYLKQYKNILFVSYDIPSYGGSSTNCHQLSTYYRNMGFNIFTIYILYNDSNIKKYSYNKNSIIIDQKNIKMIDNINFNPDVIILKTPVDYNFRNKFNCDVLYLIGGIFNDNLGQYYDELDNYDLYINKHVLTQIDNSDYIFTNSSHTQEILENNYNKKCYLFYSNFVNYYHIYIKNHFSLDSKKYDYGVIVSNFNRNIKNIHSIIEFLKDKKNVVLIGKNSDKYKSYKNFECIDILDQDTIKFYYKNIKNIINLSYYESCSNTVVEALYNGCNIINKNNLSIYNVKKNGNKMIKIEDNTLVGIFSTQYQFYGGGGTFAYYLNNILTKNNINIKLFYFINSREYNIIKNTKLENPNELKNIQYITIKSKNIEKIFNENKFTKIIAINYGIIPHITKYYNSEIIYQIIGSPELTLGEYSPINCNISYTKFMKDYENIYLDKDNLNYKYNLKSIIYSNTCITNTILTDNIYKTIFKEHENKFKYIEPVDLIIYSLNHKIKNKYKYGVKYLERKYDLICISSNWDRKVKNVSLIQKIFKLLPSYNKIVIGNNVNKYFDENYENITLLEFQSQKQIYKLLKNSKLYLLTSFFESASITLLEAIKCGCKVLTSKNIGLCNILNDECLCNDIYDENEWINKIENLNNQTIIKYNIKDYTESDLLNIYMKNNDINKDKCLFFVTYDAPSHGGASTNLFEFYNYFKNYYPCYILFIENNKSIKINENIKKSNNIFIYDENELDKKYLMIMDKLREFKDVKIIYKIYKTHHILQKYFSIFTDTIYCLSGLKIINNLMNHIQTYDYNYLLNHYYKFISKENMDYELKPMEFSKNILFNSNITFNIFNNIYNHYFTKNIYNPKIKIINTSIIFKNNCVNHKYDAYKDIDILFACSNYKRKIKNANYIINLFKEEKLKKIKKVIIGNKFPSLNYIENLNIINHLEQNDFFKYLERAKIVIIPSFFDSSPNLLYEGLLYNCNVLISKNIDCPIINDYYKIDLNNQYDTISKIEEILDNKKNENYEKIFNEYKETELEKLISIIES